MNSKNGQIVVRDLDGTERKYDITNVTITIGDVTLGGFDDPGFEVKADPAVMAKWSDAHGGVMFPRTIDPNAPVPPKPPSTLPKAAPSTPAVTRTGTSKAGPQTARLVPCAKSKWHKHHPANELCGECDPPKKTPAQEMDYYFKTLNEKMKAFRNAAGVSPTGRTIPRTGGYPPWAAPAHPVYALQKPTWHSPGDYRGWQLTLQSAPAGDVLLGAIKGRQSYATTYRINNKVEEDRAYVALMSQIDSIEGP